MIEKISYSTLSQHDKEDRMKDYKDNISNNKSFIARFEDDIISYEEELGGRGESSIIRNY